MRVLRAEIPLRTALTADELAQKIDLTASKIYRGTRKIRSDNRNVVLLSLCDYGKPIKIIKLQLSIREAQRDLSVGRRSADT